MRHKNKPLYWLQIVTRYGLEQSLYNDLETLIIKAEDNPNMIAYRISDYQYNITQAEHGNFECELSKLELKVQA